METPDRQGDVVVIAGPSGSGKSTICARLCERPGFQFSVSATTRAPRPGEREGTDYCFVTRERFEAMRERGDILESSEHFDNLYGTPRKPVEEAVAAGRNVVLDIDVNGAEQVKRLMPEARFIFVLPPNREELERRLRSRGTEDDAAVRERLRRADMETTRADAFDLRVVNDDLDRAVDEVAQWLHTEVSQPNGP